MDITSSPPRTLVNLGLTELTIQQKNRGNANHDLQTNIHCAFQKAGLESGNSVQDLSG